MDHKGALDYAYLFLERSYECDLLRSVVRSEQRKVMELKLGADLNEIDLSATCSKLESWVLCFTTKSSHTRTIPASTMELSRLFQ